MTKILITGAGSYIGTTFETYIKEHFSDGYTIDTVDMIDGSWREKDFSPYDAVFHVAGIAHQKETKENAGLYYKVNRDLAIETAEKAKTDGVKQFVFLSSMSVYGMDIGVITRETAPNPVSNYGKSKLQAEEKIGCLADHRFKVCILRPPMVYGDGCKGNYQTLSKWAKKLPIFPDIVNKRSMIHIDQLCKQVKQCMDMFSAGVFFPQDDEYMCTSALVKKVAADNNHKIHMTKIFNPAISVMKILNIRIFNKIFGDLYYDRDCR